MAGPSDSELKSIQEPMKLTLKRIKSFFFFNLSIPVITYTYSLGFVPLYSYELQIKQFMVTNCSKEQPSSIVNETLKNGILMLKYTSKESDFHADFKYISFIKFSLCHQKLRA